MVAFKIFFRLHLTVTVKCCYPGRVERNTTEGKTMKTLSINEVKPGDYVGFKYGAGDEYLDSIFIAVRVQSGRFGDSLIVKDTNGNTEHVSSFVSKGIGCYYIGENL
jgi:hypothetical protein